MAKKGIWVDKNTFVQFSEKTTRPLSDEIATRDRSIDFYSLGMYLPNPDPILKKTGKDIKVYTELKSDAYMGGCISSRKSGVKSLEWEIDRGKAKSRQAKLVTDLFNDLDMDSIIGEILEAPLMGYQALEVIWKQIGQYWLPVRISGKPQHWFVFHADDNSLRLRTKENMMNGEVLPPRKFLLAQHEATYENPYGMAELSRCFWPVTFKKGGMKFWVIFLEKYGMPFAIGKHPRGLDPKEADKLLDMLENMVQDAIAVIPDDSSVEIMAGGAGKGSASSDLYEKLINNCKTDIAIALLGQNLTTEVKGGSYAAAESHMSVRKDIIDSDKRLVVRTFNELIKWIYELNFAGGERPIFGMYEEEDVDTAQAERDKTLADTKQIKFSKKYFMKTYGFEEEDIEIIEPANTPSPPLNLRGGAAAQFAESPLGRGVGVGNLFPDQQAIDDTVASIPVKEMQAQMEGVLKPVITLINKGASYEDILKDLLDTYPEMKSKDIEDMIARAIFVCEVWGRINANN